MKDKLVTKWRYIHIERPKTSICSG